MTVRARATDLGFTWGWKAVKRMPEGAAGGVFRTIADTAWRRRGKGVLRLESNLARVMGTDPADPAIRALSRTAMRSYLRYWCETFRLPAWSRERMLDGIFVHHSDELAAALARGRGVVLALPHMGNWDHAGAWACTVHAPLTTVAERLEPADLYDQFVAYRTSLGMEVLAIDEGDVFGVLARRLKAGGLVCLLADRDLTSRGVRVDFFGGTASMPAGPAALSLITGAELRPVTVWYEGDRTIADVGERILPPETGDRSEAIRIMTQQVADRFAEGIAAHPADWHMLQRVWVDTGATGSTGWAPPG